MLQLKVGIQLASLKQPFKKALHTAASLGADAVEIDARAELRPAELSRSAVRQLRKMLEDLNLRVSTVSFRTRRGYNVLEELDRRVEATRQALQMAYQLGASSVVNQVGRIPEPGEGRDWTLLLETLTDLGQYGQRVGATLAAETGAEDGERLHQLVSALPDGCLGVSLDPGNLLINGFSVSEAARLLGPHILHVHARDAVRDLARGRGLEVALGRGSVDFPELCAILEEQNYRGYFTIKREHSEQVQVELAAAVEYLQHLFRG